MEKHIHYINITLPKPVVLTLYVKAQKHRFYLAMVPWSLAMLFPVTPDLKLSFTYGEAQGSSSAEVSQHCMLAKGARHV